VTDVLTVLGPVPADKLGATLTHEHLILDLSRVTRDANGVLNEVPLAIRELGYFRRAGGATIVEVRLAPICITCRRLRNAYCAPRREHTSRPA